MFYKRELNCFGHKRTILAEAIQLTLSSLLLFWMPKEFRRATETAELLENTSLQYVLEQHMTWDFIEF